MINGILNVYKEAGFTSHDVVAVLRRLTGQKKIGHTGTLDPDAVGVLPVCLGKATKLCGLLTDEKKSYEAVLRLGITTDTQDISGTVLEERPVQVTEAAVRECLMSFLGNQKQIPPMYSALKQNGRKLYELAREGIVVERPARPVTFFELNILEMKLPEIRFSVTCSKGTYIRTLCHDIGEKLGCGGCMTSLVRTRVSRFSVTEAKKLSELAEAAEEGTLLRHVMQIDAFFSELPSVRGIFASDTLLHNGNPVLCTETSAAGNRETCPKGRVRMYDSSDCFIGLYVATGKYYKPDTIFYDPDA